MLGSKYILFGVLIFLIIGLPISIAEEYAYDYDKNGNLLKDSSYVYEYNRFNQLSKVKDIQGNLLEEYSYDESGTRIKKIHYNDDGTWVKTFYIDENYIRVINSSGTFDIKYVYLDGILVGREENGKKYFYHPDHLGSTSLITDQNGNVVERTEYLPYGEATAGGNDRYTFTGKEYDDSSLMYYESRYYSPFLGIFTQADSMLPDVYDPQQLNRYSYARNNPLLYTDPSGHYIETALDIASISWSLYDLKKDPTSLLNWVSLGADVVTLALPIVAGGGAIVKGASKIDDAAKLAKGVNRAVDASKVIRGIDKAGDATKIISKADDAVDVVNSMNKVGDVGKISVHNLYGHASDDAANLFRAGAKSHVNRPIEVIRIGDNYMINDGVGRTVRAMKNGEEFVNAKVIRSYDSDIEMIFSSDSIVKTDLSWWRNKVTKMDDPLRWQKLGVTSNG